MGRLLISTLMAVVAAEVNAIVCPWSTCAPILYGEMFLMVIVVSPDVIDISELDAEVTFPFIGAMILAFSGVQNITS